MSDAVTTFFVLAMFAIWPWAPRKRPEAQQGCGPDSRLACPGLRGARAIEAAITRTALEAVPSR